MLEIVHYFFSIRFQKREREGYIYIYICALVRGLRCIRATGSARFLASHHILDSLAFTLIGFLL